MVFMDFHALRLQERAKCKTCKYRRKMSHKEPINGKHKNIFIKIYKIFKYAKIRNFKNPQIVAT